MGVLSLWADFLNREIGEIGEIGEKDYLLNLADLPV
jgi:hypothetical protein